MFLSFSLNPTFFLKDGFPKRQQKHLRKPETLKYQNQQDDDNGDKNTLDRHDPAKQHYIRLVELGVVYIVEESSKGG